MLARTVELRTAELVAEKKEVEKQKEVAEIHHFFKAFDEIITKYDIWGDTVNIASRMESSGEAGKVNISGSTYHLVKEVFACSHRGKIEAKGKGEIDMYYVEGLKTP